MDSIARAAAAIRRADLILIAAGAGMGVDSGLPDFRGTEGFWKAYPPLARLGLDFYDLAQPRWFERDPALAWGFYGHRLSLYRATAPHAGFEILRRWSLEKTVFVFTSNVDGHFQKAGFERVVECHGSLHRLQCTSATCDALWSADGVSVAVDEATFRALPPLPTCPACGRIARPNLLLFDDPLWRHEPYGAAEERLVHALYAAPAITVVEIGAGQAVPTVRWFTERLQRRGAALIRINPREADGPPGTISIPLGAREALERMEGVRSGDREIVRS